jgi:hypothetical protein
MKIHPFLACSLLALASSSCTIISVDSDSDLPGLRIDGVVNGHLAFGMSDEEDLFNASILSGTPSQGGVAAIRFGNILGVEVGLVGAAFMVGPLHFGIGTLFYDPETPNIDTEDEGEKGEKGDLCGACGDIHE